MSPEERLRESIESFVTRVRQDLDVHGQSLSVDLTAALRDEREAWKVERDRALADEHARAAAVLEGERAALGRAHRGAVARLLAAMRRLEAATSLAGILEALADAARDETARSVLLLLEGSALKPWRAAGFDEGRAPSAVAVDADRQLGGVVEDMMPATVRGGTGDPGPPWLRPGPGTMGRLVPLTIGGHVAAVLYAEGPDPEAAASGGCWPEAVEILVRHGATRLENLTSIRTVEALTRPA